MHRNSISDQMMHYYLLTYSSLCGPALTLTEIFLNINELMKEKGNNYRYL